MQEFFSHIILTTEQLKFEVAQNEVAILKAKIKKLRAEIAGKSVYKNRVKINLN